MASHAAKQPLRQAARHASTSTTPVQSGGAFFPIQAAPSRSVPAVPKPPSQEWYTGRPTFTSTQTQLERALTSARAHLYRQGLLKSISSSTGHDAEFHSVLPHPRERKWKHAKDMATYLRTGAQLKSSQYKKLTATLANLEGLLPYARVADSLAESDSLAVPPRLVIDPVARATGRQDGDSASGAVAEPSTSSSDLESDRPSSLYAQLDQLLARFQHVSASGSSAIQHPLGKARRLGERDEFGRVMASGARKEAGARVWILPTTASSSAGAAASTNEGTSTTQDYPFGRVVVNAKSLPDYFPAAAHREAVVRPMSLVSALGAFNVFAIVKGSGVAAQADAVAVALARALAEWERIEVEEGRRQEGAVSWRDILKRANLLERDPRMVERKKPGHVKARKMPTWVKR